MSCLLTARVTGCSRVPEPPARMIPLRFMVTVSAVWVLLGSARHQLGKHALYAELPCRHGECERALELAGGQPRIARTRGRGRESARGHFLDRLRCHSDVAAMRAGPIDHVTRIAMPARFARGHQVVGA